MRNIIIDCTNYRRGRLISAIRSYLKADYLVHLYNIDYFVICGQIKQYVDRYKRIVSAGHNLKGPFTTFNKFNILRRTIKGMHKEDAKKVRLYDTKPVITDSQQYPKQEHNVYVKAFYYKELIKKLNSK